VNGISLEIQDVLPAAQNALFAFVESNAMLDKRELQSRMSRVVTDQSDSEKLLELLLWYGFLGVVRGNLEEVFIYSVLYDSRKLKAMIGNLDDDDRIFVINPAFHRGLEIRKGT
jgi:hypothetical protein